MASVFLNGEIVDEKGARISVNDRGLLLGDGLFETMRGYAGQVFRLGAHLARLRASVEFLRLKFTYSDEEIADRIGDLIERNGCPDAYVRLTVTRGETPRGLRMDGASAPTVLICVRPIALYPPDLYRRGMQLIISTIRQNSASPLPRHKTLNYLPYMLAKQEAVDANAGGAILINEHGQVTEESVSNLFLVRQAGVLTPPVHCGLLPGVTRAAVMELCGAEKIALEERPVAAGDLFECDEIFLTNSLMEVMPARSVDKRGIGKNVPGPVTARIQALFRELVERETTGADSAR